MPLKEDMILFETEPILFTGKLMFNFSLVRQSPNDEEEYYQIHVWMCYIFQRKKIKIFNELYGMRILKKIYSAISKRLRSLISKIGIQQNRNIFG